MTLTQTAGARRASGNLRMTPGRWVAVALAVPVALALIGWTGFTLVSAFARGSYPFSYPVLVHDGQVAVNLNEGNVTLRQAFGAQARLTGTVQYGLVRPDLAGHATATGTSVGINCDGIASDCGMSATLVVPAQTAVSLGTYGGDVAISGWTGHLALATGGGNINAGNLAGTLGIVTSGGDLTGSALTGNVQISTGGGNITADDLAGTVRVDTSGGDLTADGLSGNVQISTEDGNINANSVSAPQLTIDTGGGDVTLVFTQPPTDLNIVASDGNISVVLPPGDTKYDISTPNSSSGNVSYSSSLVSLTSPHKITLNGGGGDISITQS
jgi:Putative adhesin